LTKKAPYKGLGADSEEKREPASDIAAALVDSLKVLDPKRPIREADIGRHWRETARSRMIQLGSGGCFAAVETMLTDIPR
jgi:hypothetical protein